MPQGAVRAGQSRHPGESSDLMSIEARLRPEVPARRDDMEAPPFAAAGGAPRGKVKARSNHFL
jgi:hypothetical protein